MNITPNDHTFQLQLLKKRKYLSFIKSKNSTLINNESISHNLNTIDIYFNDMYNNELLNNYNTNTTNNTITNNMKLSNNDTTVNNNPTIRSLIFDFIYSCHTRLLMTPSSLFQTFMIIDKFSNNFVVPPCHYQLLSLTALWISSKFYDTKISIITINTLLQLCNNYYTKKQFIQMEKNILIGFNWKICNLSTHDTFIDFFLFNLQKRNQNQNKKIIKILNIYSLFLSELSFFDQNNKIYKNFNQSEIALASILSIALPLSNNNNNNNIKNICFDSRLNYLIRSLWNLLQDKDHHPTTLRLKYSNKLLMHLNKLIHFYKNSTNDLTYNNNSYHHFKIPNTPTTPTHSNNNTISQNNNKFYISFPITKSTPKILNHALLLLLSSSDLASQNYYYNKKRSASNLDPDFFD